MIMRILLAAIIINFCTILPSYALCNHAIIQSISADNTIISLINGSQWLANTDYTAVGWDKNDEIIMCGDNNMINKDQNESIPVVRIK